MSAQAELLRVLGAQLAPVGFRRRASNWYGAGSELYIVVNIQRSNWGDALYVNIGAAPIERTTDGWLPEPRCLARFRADALQGISAEALAVLSDSAFEGADLDHWRSQVAETFAKPVAAAIADVNDLSALGGLIRERVGDQVMIHREIRESLDL